MIEKYRGYLLNVEPGRVEISHISDPWDIIDVVSTVAEAKNTVDTYFEDVK